jgi:hypothetical protein
VTLRSVLPLGIFIAVGLLGRAPPAAAEAAAPTRPEISAAASAVLAHMGETLRGREFSFDAQTIRVYQGAGGEPLHIFHTLDVTVRRPNRLLVARNGDDGASRLVYDGKTLSVYAADGNAYASVPVPGTIGGMMRAAMGRLGIDFPLADFLTDAPDKAFLSGVAAGRVVNTVPIDGVPCLHMIFAQPPGIELELWLENTDRALPRRLIVTYRSLPGEPNLIATFSGWNFAVHPSDADFVFRPPPGAVKVALQPPKAAKKPGGR